jgi:hypothetical protein
MTGTVAKLKEKYPDVGPKPKSFSPTIYLFQKWAYRVEKGWYGFDLEGVPFVWGQIIDEFLAAVAEFESSFKILQIKLKFGGLRFYIRHNMMKGCKDALRLEEEIRELETWLNCKELIY